VKLKLASHLHAETILKGEFASEWKALQDVLSNAPLPLRPAGPFTASGRPMTPKRQTRQLGGKRALALLPIDQVGLNLYLDASLGALGWARQPLVLGSSFGAELDSYLKGDFALNGVFVEVEFGNTASLFRDLFKFQIAGRSGVGKVGVLVVATGPMTRLFDSGVAMFEQAEKLLPAMNIGLALPTVIVGLEIDDWAPVKDRFEEMKRVAEGQGLVCHSFDAVRRLDDPLVLLEQTQGEVVLN
jgi:hypothetical protein